MKKIIKLEGLCCANCASKIETEIKRLDGVKEVTLSFMTQRLTIEMEDEKADQIIELSKKITNKIEPDVEFKVLR